jgi:hypothetical protein
MKRTTVVAEAPGREVTMRRQTATLLLALVLGISPTVLSQGAAEVQLTDEDKLYGLSLAWKEVSYNFAFFDQVPDLDWDVEYRSAIPRVLASKSTLEYYRELQRLLALLKEGHTDVVPPRELRRANGAVPALELEEIERRAVIVNTTTDRRDEIPIGSELLEIDGFSVDDCLRRKIFPYMSASTEHGLWRRAIRGHRWTALGLLVGAPGTTISLRIETSTGEIRTTEMQRLTTRDAPVDWIKPSRNERPVFEFHWLDDGVAYAALNTFNTEEVTEAFESALPEFRKARAIVLDIRDNGGGSSTNGWNIGRHFADASVQTSIWKSPQHVAVFKAWRRFAKSEERIAQLDRHAWYEGDESHVDPAEDDPLKVPVAVLVGSSTYSAAEDFLVFMRQLPHVVFVGTTSAGSTGQPLTIDLPGGGAAGITSKRDSMPDGTEFVGYGVAPHVPVEQTLGAFREGRDLVLERAVGVLNERLATID